MCLVSVCAQTKHKQESPLKRAISIFLRGMAVRACVHVTGVHASVLCVLCVNVCMIIVSH